MANTASRPFDEAVCDALQAAMREISLAHPEVKAMSASITWNGTLNDAKILHGVWLSADGSPVMDAAGTVAGIQQSLKMIDMQMARLDWLAKGLEAKVAASAKQLLDNYKEASQANEDKAKAPDAAG